MRLFCALAIATFFAFQPAAARAQSAEEQARQRFEQGEMYMKAGVYDKAIEEYEASYELAPQAHLLLFNIGLAYENWGKRAEAKAHYQNYLARDPKGEKASEANARIAALDRAAELERTQNEEAARKNTELTSAQNPGADTPEDKGGIKWTWVAAGAAAIGAGLALDLIPKDSRNGSFELTDFLPLAFYGAGGAILFVGVF